MSDDSQKNRHFGLLLSGIVLLGALIFIFTGGELGGTQKVVHDSDLPPVAQGDTSR